MAIVKRVRSRRKFVDALPVSLVGDPKANPSRLAPLYPGC
jgi:hypothetical protein